MTSKAQIEIKVTRFVDGQFTDTAMTVVNGDASKAEIARAFEDVRWTVDNWPDRKESGQ